ncbi:hypothetical protein QBC47DRAFT_364444 [Echria macrotheca]|uniref:Uncharacterized protein n=1 Tax=Echria macrotheca TaxID=438768 RepID=A0AAJ0B4J0_9PEZI|nr:hypothetical protein QBC47DRAFT_364444 [Echria macrotheca]
MYTSATSLLKTVCILGLVLPAALAAPFSGTVNEHTKLQAKDDHPTCGSNDDCVQWGIQRCGDPFTLGVCVNGRELEGGKVKSNQRDEATVPRRVGMSVAGGGNGRASLFTMESG